MADRRANDENRSLPWADRSVHRDWLLTQGLHLLDRFRAARTAHGFADLDASGKRVDDAAKAIVTARMVHCYSVAAIMGVPGAAPLADHGLSSLLDGPLHDQELGGWFDAEEGKSRKQAYVHAFVALAAASATLAERPRSDELLAAATSTIEKRFWLTDEGVMAPSFASDWSDSEDYRGANANMHATEAFLALADATGNELWLDRALGLAKRFCHDIARPKDHLLPEHFDADWQIVPDYNKDNPKDELRPWGMTPGHFAEWAGLLLKTEAALTARGRRPPRWLLEDAIGLFDSALRHGWCADSAPGIVYSIGWDESVSVAIRPWWVQAEAANTAYMLLRRTGERRFETSYQMLWDYISHTLINREKGYWRPEVDCHGNRTKEVYPLPNDLYHAFQATVTPLLPISPSLAGGVKRHLS